MKKYQLVIQFSQDIDSEFEWLVNIESVFEKNLPCETVIGGHDIGSGQMNIFLLTDQPIAIFQRIREIFIGKNDFFAEAKIAYRNINEDDFTILWPKNLKEFKII